MYARRYVSSMTWTVRSHTYNVNYYVPAISVVCMFCFPSESLNSLFINYA